MALTHTCREGHTRHQLIKYRHNGSFFLDMSDTVDQVILTLTFSRIYLKSIFMTVSTHEFMSCYSKKNYINVSFSYILR